MRCLHLFSDWKWTGPAEPVVSLCEELARQGLDVTLAYRKTPLDEFPERTVGKEVERRRVKGFEGFRLSRYFSLKDWLFDFRTLGGYVRQQRIDIVHTHLSHDHSTAVVSLLFRGDAPLVIRTDHKRDGLEKNWTMARLFARTDGVAAYAERIRQADIHNFRYPEERTVMLPPGLRMYSGPTADLRKDLGIEPDEKVVGVIGRLKPDRGYDVILKGFKLLREHVAKVKLVIVGRSSQIEESIKKPLAALGLEKDVILAGYRTDDYFSMISTFDLFLMMRAGSDGTARALREVMGMGRPAIVSDRGMLPELVKDGVSGYVVSDEHKLADRMARVLSDEGLRARLGEAARKIAVEEWNYETQAKKLINFYEKILAMGKRK
ncbi:MAG: Spore coat protein SA [Syntrophorhabdaceae bacterium PtaU1.Bin034]|nr:MAG: Spore coat protein SA [Syntrophorhabdaceae bacterium PtaU1.Bin034]